MPQYLDVDHVRGEESIDSRDLIELREQLSADLSDIETDGEPEAYEGQADELREGIAAIDTLADVGLEDWQYGAQFIREDCFEDYARELAEDIGAIDRDANWPLTYIDWPAAADALSQDFTTVEFLGHTYYAR